jgi:hypothetical protein
MPIPEELANKIKIHKEIILGDPHGQRILSFVKGGINKEYEKELYNIECITIVMVYSFILMLLTKGVKFKEHRPPVPKSRKARKRMWNNKTARFVYKTLEIHLKDGSVINLDGKHGSNVRDACGVHLCKLARKSYGMIPGEGLYFGKHRRIVIVPSHMRGKAKHRAIKKNYLVKVGERHEKET